jgi:hypothetical protein
VQLAQCNWRSATGAVQLAQCNWRSATGAVQLKGWGWGDRRYGGYFCTITYVYLLLSLPKLLDYFVF